jgi:hypothetical protein
VVAAQARRAAAETAQVCDAVLIGHHGVAPEGSRRAWPSKGCKVRMTDFWSRLEEAFGPAYSRSLARDQAFTELDGRTIDEAIAQGVETVTVWRAVVATFPDRVPSQLR